MTWYLSSQLCLVRAAGMSVHKQVLNENALWEAVAGAFLRVMIERSFKMVSSSQAASQTVQVLE